MRNSGFLAVVLAAAVTVGCDAGNRNDADQVNGSAIGTGGEAANVSGADSDFVRDLTVANMAEVELGKMAAEKGMNAEVKQFGQSMVADHTKAHDSLAAIATRHNITVPTALDDDHRELRDRLAKLQGAEFDREYMDAMVDGHQGVLDKLESRVDSVKLAEWRTKIAGDRSANATPAPQPNTAIEPVVAERSDDPVTMSINEWAATSYPVVYQHLERSKTINEIVERGVRPTQ